MWSPPHMKKLRQNNSLRSGVVPGGCSDFPFSSRYRHHPISWPQQMKGYQCPRVTVNRHRLCYGMCYGGREPQVPPMAPMGFLRVHPTIATTRGSPSSR
jgi:hypothetical protein